MPEDTSKYFDTDPDWASYAESQGSKPLSDAPAEEIIVLGPGVSAGRAAQLVEEGAWAETHPLNDLGYSSYLETVRVRDDAEVEIKVYRPSKKATDQFDANEPSDSKMRLPLVFVCHGGGWVQGTHTTEERWLVQPLMKKFNLCIVSVAYRLAPEYPYPIYINDCWDALQAVLKRADHLGFEKNKVILAGSSAGGLIAAALSQKARDCQLPVHGVLLNVPVLCDYRHWPADLDANRSYEQCSGAMLSSGLMRGVWELVVPREQGKTPEASPLLGDVAGLPPHSIFIAGQDPLRDEGIAYARKLSSQSVDVRMHVYSGVPHTFGEIWELQSTAKFWQDLETDMRSLLNGNSSDKFHTAPEV